MSYANTFIRVAPDCPVTAAAVPAARGGAKSVPLLEYELLTARPYELTQEDLIYEVHVRHKAIPEAERNARGAAIRADLFRKPHPCFRASSLAKRYGWGAHFDGRGRIALYAVESPEYRRFVDGAGGVTVLTAMRSKRV